MQNVKELKKKVEELTHNWKRALADYQNLERRIKDDKEQFVKYAKASIIEQLLPAVDGLEKVREHTKDQGLDLSIKTIWNILFSEGLKEIDAMDKQFDPHRMEAIDVVSGEEGKVLEVFQKGYMLFDRVLRPAKVKVGKVLNVKKKE